MQPTCPCGATYTGPDVEKWLAEHTAKEHPKVLTAEKINGYSVELNASREAFAQFAQALTLPSLGAEATASFKALCEARVKAIDGLLSDV